MLLHFQFLTSERYERSIERTVGKSVTFCTSLPTSQNARTFRTFVTIVLSF